MNKGDSLEGPGNEWIRNKYRVPAKTATTNSVCEHKAYRAVNYSLNYFAHNSQPCPLSNYNSPGKARTPQPLVCWAPPSWPPSHCEYLWFRVTQAQLMDLYNSNEHDDDADSNSKLQWQQDNNCIYIYIYKRKQNRNTQPMRKIVLQDSIFRFSIVLS